MNNLQDAMKRLEARLCARSSHQAGHSARVSQPPQQADGRQFFIEGIATQRPYLESIPLQLPGIGTLIYRGQRLAADDRAVWQQLLLRAMRSPQEDTWLSFPSLGLLRAMGWGVGSHDKGRLRACLERLQAAWIRCPASTPGSGSNLPLIAGCTWQPLPSGRSDRWRVKLSPEICQIFAHWEALGTRHAA